MWSIPVLRAGTVGRNLLIRTALLETISNPWPWYIAGPAIGLMVPLLLIFAGKPLGISSSLRHICAATIPSNLDYFKYDWKNVGLWNLIFAGGMIFGGFIGAFLLTAPDPTIAISAATVTDLKALGVTDFSGLMPDDFFSWSALTTLPGFLMVVLGGFLTGFGARYAGGCTSGHAIMGLSNLQLPSLVAVIGFFVGGLIVTHWLLPLFIG